ncbi:MAG TPA: trehalase family glycosidase [Xanthomonadales bacterium]|nr:trehalase family glycosidase [Xanthomonadales bacterium]
MRREMIEDSGQTAEGAYPRPALFKKTLNRIEAIQAKALPDAERIIDNLTTQLTENVSLHRFNGSEIPYSSISSSKLPPEFLKKTSLAQPDSTPKKKLIRVIFSGFAGNITSGLPLAMEEIFSTIADNKNGGEKPEIVCYVIGQPTKVDKNWRKGQRKNKLAMHGDAGTDLLATILSGEDTETADLELHGESMSTYTASYAAQSLDEKWIPKTRLFLNNPPGSHQDRIVPAWQHFGSRVQLGVGYVAENARRKRRNKHEGNQDSSLEDREYATSLASALRKRGIEIAGKDTLRSLTRSQLWDLWNLGKRPPLPKTNVETYITQGVNDLTRLSLRDKYAYKRGEHVRTEGNIVLRLSPTSHTVNPLSPQRINSMLEVLLDKEKLLDSLERKIMDTNWHDDHTYPAPYHYKHLWLWDSVFAANINAQRGDVKKAAIEIDTLLNGVDPVTGFIPNMQYRTGRNWRDIESATFNNPDFGSSYTQPPVIAWGAWETYEAFKNQGQEKEGRMFLENQHEKLEKFYSYFINFRENGDGSRLIGNTFPHETGRDSDPSLRPKVPFIKGEGKAVGLTNTVVDYLTVLALNVDLKWKDTYPERGRPTARDIVDFAKNKIGKRKPENVRTDWDPDKTRGVYWTNDVMFNVLYVENLRYMTKINSELGRNDKAEEYRELANQVETEMLNKMWDSESGFFYSLDKNGEQIKIPSITGLFATCLDTIAEDKLSAVIGKMEDNNWFNTEYPFPSVPTHNQYYQPDYSEKRLWKRGEVWINANQLIAEEGLVKQLQRPDLSPKIKKRMLEVLRKLVDKTEKLVNTDLLENGTTHEFYNAESGEGYRIKGFTWTLGGRHMHNAKALLEQIDTEAE